MVTLTKMLTSKTKKKKTHVSSVIMFVKCCSFAENFFSFACIVNSELLADLHRSKLQLVNKNENEFSRTCTLIGTPEMKS